MYVLAQVEWGSVVVAVALICMVAVIMIVTLMRSSVDGALKMWGGLGTIVGLMSGIMGTYFFTQRVEQEKEQRIEQFQSALKERDQDREVLREQLALAKSAAPVEVLHGNLTIPPEELTRIETMAKTIEDADTRAAFVEMIKAGKKGTLIIGEKKGKVSTGDKKGNP
jgi:hypothetical protein